MDLTNSVRLLKWPFVREIRGLDSRGVTFCWSKMEVSRAQRVTRMAEGEGQRNTYMALLQANGDAATLYRRHRDSLLERWWLSIRVDLTVADFRADVPLWMREG